MKAPNAQPLTTIEPEPAPGQSERPERTAFARWFMDNLLQEIRAGRVRETETGETIH